MADLGMGAASLALEFCKISKNYIEGVCNSKKKSAAINQDLISLADNLERLRSTIQNMDSCPHQQIALQHIDKCSDAFQPIRDKLGAEESLRRSKGKQRVNVIKERLLWPFKENDVLFLEERLRKMESQLDLVISTLHMEIAGDTNDKVAELAQTSEANDQAMIQSIQIFRQDSLGMISKQSEIMLSNAEASEQQIKELKADFFSKIDQLEKKLDKHMQGDTPALVASINENISEFHDIANDINQQQRKMIRKTALTQKCTCTPRSITKVYNQRPITITKTHSTTHHPKCRYALFEEVAISLQMRFTVCSTLLGRKAHMVLALTRSGGSDSIQPTLRCDRVVPESSPAFKLLKNFKRRLDRGMGEIAWRVPATQMERLFMLRKASPYDRLPNGMTLLHYFCANMQKWFFEDAEFLVPNYYAMGQQMLEFLRTQNMEKEKDDEGLSCVDYFVGGVHSDLVEHFIDHGGISVSICRHAEDLRWNWERYGIRIVEDVEDSLDCSDVMKAILLKSEEKLMDLIEQDLVSSDTHESNISLYEMATRSGWKRGCEIMFENGFKITRYAKRTDTLLHCAIVSRHAHMVQFWLEMRRHLLDELEVQCVGSIEDAVVDICKCDNAFTEQCLVYCVAALVKQRQELSSLAEEYSIKIPSDRLIDAQAFSIIRRLEKYGVNVKASLKPTRRSVYHVPYSRWETSVLSGLYDAGFRDITAEDFKVPNDFAVSPLFYLWSSTSTPVTTFSLVDIPQWFLSRGASLTETWPGSEITLAHSMAYRIGSRCYSGWYDREEELCQYFEDQNKDGCCCPCSTSGCRFVTAFCKGLTTPYELENPSESLMTEEKIESAWYSIRCSWRDRVSRLTDFVGPATVLLKNRWLISEAIRLIVFNGLGIRHTCCNLWLIMKDREPDYNGRPTPRYSDTEELELIQDEDAHLVQILEDLVQKFEKWWDDGDHWMYGLSVFAEHHIFPEMETVLQRLKEEDEENFRESRIRLGVSMRGGDDESEAESSEESDVDTEDESDSDFDESELRS